MLKNKLIVIIVLVAFLVVFSPTKGFTADKVGINEAINLALENNRTLLAAEQKLTAAEKGNEAAESVMNYNLSGQISWQDEELTEDGNLFSSINYSKFLAESAGIGAKLDKAELKLLAAQIEFEKLRKEVLLNVIEQYYNLLKLQKLEHKQKAVVEEAESLYFNAQQRYQDSLIKKADLLRMEINLDKSRQALKSLENNKTTAEAQFMRLTGIEKNNLILKEDKLISDSYELNIKSLLKAALKNRSDYNIQLLNTELINADIKYLKSEQKPVFSIGGEYVHDDGKVEASVNSKYQLNLKGSFDTVKKNETYIALKNLQLLEESEWKVTAALSYQFSDGGQKEAEIEAAAARLRESKIKLEDLKSEIEIEISQLLRELDEKRESIKIADKNHHKAELEYQSVVNRYNKGAVIESEVVSAHKLLFEAETESILAEYHYHLKKAELLAALEKIYSSFKAEKLGGDI